MPSPEFASEFVVRDVYKYDTRSPGRWIASHLLRHTRFLVTFLIGAFSNAAGAAIIPTLVGIAFDEILRPQPDLDTVSRVAVLALASQMLRAGLQFMRNDSAEVLGQSIERDSRQELYASLLGKSMTFHSMQAVGDIMARATNDVHELNLMLNPGINMVIGSAMFLLVPVTLSPTINPQLILSPALFTIAYILAIRLYMSQLHPATEAVRTRFGEMNAKLAEAIDGIETVKGASQEYSEIERFDSNATEFRNAFVQQSDIEARFIPLLLLGIAVGIAFAHALILFRAGQITVGNVVTYMGYMSLYGFPVFVSLFGFSNLSLGLAAASRILPLILTKTDLDENRAGYHAEIKGEVKFENVTFTYPGGTPALQNVTFEVKPGQVAALVGQTGVGKSTLAKLINRTYDVTSGRVLIDGIDVRDWHLESLRSQISIIEQDLFLFSRSFTATISFGVPDASQEQIEQAARDAQAHEF